MKCGLGTGERDALFRVLLLLLLLPFADRLGLATDRAIAITLAAICLGAAVTCGNRLRLIATELRARPR